MPRTHKACYNDAQIQWIWQQYISGYTINELAAAVHLSPGTLQYHFLRLGLHTTKDRRPPIQERLHELAALGDAV